MSTIAFQDAKRPYTKKILERIDFNKIVGNLTVSDLVSTEESLGLSSHATLAMYDSFKSLLNIEQLNLF